MKAGFVPLVIALMGALFVVLYSAGKSPISYLPLGEVVSGVVMGGLIPLAVYLVLTGELDFTILLLSIPTILGVGLIMFTNNTCDIERDIPSGRKTLSVVLGRTNSRALYRLLVIVWIVDMIHEHIETTREKKKGTYVPMELREIIAEQILPFRWALYLGVIAAVVIFGIYGSAFDASSFMYA